MVEIYIGNPYLMIELDLYIYVFSMDYEVLKNLM